MDKGRAMTGLQRHIKASLALLLLTGLATGCAHHEPWAPRVAEEIPAQVCGGSGDTDGDGVTDCYDRCPDTLRGQPSTRMAARCRAGAEALSRLSPLKRQLTAKPGPRRASHFTPGLNRRGRLAGMATAVQQRASSSSTASTARPSLRGREVGGRARGHRVLRGGDLRDGGATTRPAGATAGFAARRREDACSSASWPCSRDTPELDEDGFEAALWQRLQALHRLDARNSVGRQRQLRSASPHSA
jgi:hypothetical protein